MRRGYSREAYIQLINRAREIVPDVAVSSDFISGFCGETDQEHKDTVSLMEQVAYDQAFMFAYSMREKTPAHRRFQSVPSGRVDSVHSQILFICGRDDVPESTKKERLQEVINTFNRVVKQKSQRDIGKYHLVLVEGESKRSDDDLFGRSDTNKRVVFAGGVVPPLADLVRAPETPSSAPSTARIPKAGDYVVVKVHGTTGVTLLGSPVALSSIQEFNALRPQLEQQ